FSERRTSMRLGAAGGAGLAGSGGGGGGAALAAAVAAAGGDGAAAGLAGSGARAAGAGGAGGGAAAGFSGGRAGVVGPPEPVEPRLPNIQLPRQADFVPRIRANSGASALFFWRFTSPRPVTARAIRSKDSATGLFWSASAIICPLLAAVPNSWASKGITASGVRPSAEAKSAGLISGRLASPLLLMTRRGGASFLRPCFS